jgi:hypothetical protein
MLHSHEPVTVGFPRSHDRIFRYVVHARVTDYLNCGWHIAEVDLGAHHRQYAILLEWLCRCPCAEPRNLVR